MPAVAETFRHDAVEMQREMLLWQRWVRYGVATLGMLMTLLLALPDPWGRAWAAPVVVAALYVLITAGSTFVLRGSRAGLRYVPAALMMGDVVLVTAFVYFSTSPAHAHVVLLAGLLVLQLTLFYFGLALGIWAALLAVAGYVLVSLMLPPWIPGVRPPSSEVVVNTTVFLFATAILVLTFGNFRERMNQLRALCKRVEGGDLGGTIAAERDRPDDLSLLTRSFVQMRGRLVELVGTDPLTGCLNRRAFEMRLGREWRQAKRRDSALALVAIDLDSFKPINDDYGHAVGDLVLRELAEIMFRSARDTDAVARIGGDEFMVLLPDSGWPGATTFAERVRHAVDTCAFGGAHALELTVSVGVAVARAKDDVTPEFLLEEADRRLYQSKFNGRNRVTH